MDAANVASVVTPEAAQTWLDVLLSRGIAGVLAIGLLAIAWWGLQREKRADALAGSLLEVVKANTAAAVELRGAVQAVSQEIRDQRSDRRRPS